MHDQSFRTGLTWLTDDQLILLDVLFDGGSSLRLLRRENFRGQWNLGYTHNLDGTALECNIHFLCENNVLRAQDNRGHTWFRMTRDGGDLGTLERCPVWERYCSWRGGTTSRGRTRTSVMAVTPEVRDHFLALWPQYPARRKTALISDVPLIAWRPFPRLYVGVATYEEPHRWTPAEYFIWAEQWHQHWARLDRERSWWGWVPELQKFVASTSNGNDDSTPGLD